MKRISMGVIALAASAFSAQAADVWAGNAYIYAARNCGTWSYVGDHFYARFLPRSAANGNSSYLTLYEFDNWATSYTLANADFDGTARKVSYGSIYYGVSTIPASATTPIPPPRIKFTSIVRTPAATTTTVNTKFVNVTGTILNFDPLGSYDTTTQTGCDVDFRMSLGKVAFQ